MSISASEGAREEDLRCGLAVGGDEGTITGRDSMNKVTSVEDYKIVSNFQALRKQLLEDKYSDRLEKPLAYWALPNDRRLPMAFLSKSCRQLLASAKRRSARW